MNCRCTYAHFFWWVLQKPQSIIIHESRLLTISGDCSETKPTTTSYVSIYTCRLFRGVIIPKYNISPINSRCDPRRNIPAHGIPESPAGVAAVAAKRLQPRTLWGKVLRAWLRVRAEGIPGRVASASADGSVLSNLLHFGWLVLN